MKRTLLQAKPYWPHIACMFLLDLLSSPISLLKPFPLKLVIDSGFGSHPVSHFIRWFFPTGFPFNFSAVIAIAACLVIFIAIAENIVDAIAWILSTFTGEKVQLDFRARLFDHVQRLSIAYHDNKGSADSLYKLQWDTVGIRTLLIGNISPLISSLITLVSMTVVMFLINLHFALIALCIIPPLFILTKISTNRLQKDWYKVKDAESRTMSVVHEVLGTLRVVKAFGQESNEGRRFVNTANKAVNGQLKVAWVAAIFYFVVGIVFATGTAFFIYLGAQYIREGKMTLGELTLVIAYLAQIFGPLQVITKKLNDIQSSVTSIKRVFLLLDQEKEVPETLHPVYLARAKGSVEFLNVSFSYGDERKALHQVSCKVAPGDRVGIMGSTGSGKSTLVSLIMRFYDPTEGIITMDDHDIRDYKLADYRNQFSLVLQDPVLFSTSISENIRYGNRNATEDALIEAAKAANAHDFIMRCRDGYDTLVGERGMQLSGGERQRISIARAFIKNAPILVLDEPTSSVDIKTEALILEAIERLMEGRTTFLITHRLDALSSCNLILHVEEGKLIDMVWNKTAFRDKTAFLQEKIIGRGY